MSSLPQPHYAAKPGPWQTFLSLPDELNFQSWVKRNNIPFNLQDKTPDYDMRGYYKALMAGNPQAQQAFSNNHFPDTWKTPYHQTFSNESIYANPLIAPHWSGNKLFDVFGNLVKDESGGK